MTTVSRAEHDALIKIRALQPWVSGPSVSLPRLFTLFNGQRCVDDEKESKSFKLNLLIQPIGMILSQRFHMIAERIYRPKATLYRLALITSPHSLDGQWSKWKYFVSSSSSSMLSEPEDCADNNVPIAACRDDLIAWHAKSYSWAWIPRKSAGGIW